MIHRLYFNSLIVKYLSPMAVVVVLLHLNLLLFDISFPLNIELMFLSPIFFPFRQSTTEFVIIKFNEPGIDMLSAEWTDVVFVFDIEVTLFADNMSMTANLDRLPHKIVEAICAYATLLISSGHC